jgi:iron complex outermembrane receptor protein
MRILLLLVAGATALQAQSPRDSITRDTARLSPTVVTVLRSSTELARTPYSIGIATRDEIQRGKPGLALDEALAGIPGVQVDNRFNYALGERISVRGLGARAQFGVRGVRVLLDGIPMTLADGQTSLNNVDVAMLARAEVVRGPASAVHGNASGGVIQLESDRGDEFARRRGGGELRGGFGADGLARYQLMTRGAIGNAYGVVSVSQLSYDGYRDWNTAKNDHINFQVGRYFSAGKLTLLGNHVNYDATNPGGLTRDSARLKPFMAWPTNKDRFATGEEGKQTQLGGTWQQSIGTTGTLDISAHGLTRSIENPIPNSIVAIDRRAGGGRASLSLISMVTERPLHFAFGGELQVQRDERQNYVNTPNSGAQRGALTLDQLERVTNQAFFAQASNQVTSRLTLMAGIRHDRINFDAADHLTTPTDESGERTMSATSPSVGATLEITPMLSLFTNYSTSFETPTTSELANQASGAGGFNPDLEPQRARSAELGANGRVSVGGVAGSYQIAAYRANVKDALIPFEIASAPGRQYFRNAGSTKHRGVEFGTSLALPRGVGLRGSYTHTEALFDEYAVTSGTTTTVFDDNYVPGVAPNRGDVTLSSQFRKAFAEFEARFSSGMHVNDANTDTSRTAGYEVYGARAGLRDLSVGALTFEPHIGVFNLLDRRYMTSVVVNAFGGRFYEPGPPRSVYAGLSAKF